MTFDERLKSQLGNLLFQMEGFAAAVDELQRQVAEKDKRIAELEAERKASSSPATDIPAPEAPN